MIVIGITGGIASGKSYVTNMLRDAGAPVLDADSLGHMVLKDIKEAKDKVLEVFGTSMLDENNNINRSKLGNMVFKSDIKKELLNKIIHPHIALLAKQSMELISKKGHKLAFYEAALLVETGIYKNLDSLILVYCSLKTQLARLIKRDSLSSKDASLRIAAQYPLEEKQKVADYTINTDNSFEETKTATLEIYDKVKRVFLDS